MSTLSHLHLSVTLCALAFIFMAGPLLAASGIERKAFGQGSATEPPVDEFILTNNNGASVSVISYGAIVTRLVMPDKFGKLGDVVLGFDNLKQYQEQTSYFGACIGRVGNRIAHGVFSVDNVRYCVPINNGPNHLHGGFKGYDKHIWAAEPAMTPDGPSVRFHLVDQGSDEGYPGNVTVTVIYTLTGDNALKIQYYATTDKATPINLTNHSYFNLKDGGKSSIANHILKLYADSYTPVDENLIPTGEIAPVKGTPFDFTSRQGDGQGPGGHRRQAGGL